MLIDGVDEFLRIVIMMPHAGHQRPEGIAPVFITHHAQRAQGVAMVAVITGYNISAACGPAAQLYSAFRGLRTRIDKVYAIQIFR